jgi:hypothetical protein
LIGKKVGSFGDGPGFYKEKLLELKEVVSYEAFDGAPFCEETTNGEVKFLDLSVPIFHLPHKYDWIVSVEVGEHIPQEFEQVYLDNLVRYAREGIVLSWAHLEQGGHSHVNNRDFPYIKTQMESRGLIHDNKSSQMFRQEAHFGWFKDNLNVFRVKNSS